MKGRTLLIGILEASNEKNSFELLKNMFVNLGYNQKSITISNDFVVLNKENANILLLDINLNSINSLLDLGFQFDIIIHTSLEDEAYQNKKIKELVAGSKYFIINSDEERWTDLLNDNIMTIVITYGFNNKATINLSSYNKQDLVEANICVQREIETIEKTIVEPFELPVKIDTKEKLNIYSILSIMACCLVMGIDLLNINISAIYKQ